MSIVEVRPIERERWHKKQGKDSFARPITLEAPVSATTGQYATGLTDEDQERLEKMTGYDLSKEYINGKPHPFWSSTTARINLEHKTNIFDTSRPLDEIKVKVLKAHDLVANSMKDYMDGKYPYAMFVIYDENEEVDIKAAAITMRREIVELTSKMSKEKKAESVQILSNISVKGKSDNFVDAKLDEAIEAAGYDKTLTLLHKDKKRTTIQALVLEAIGKSVLRKQGTSVYYMDDQIGYDVDNAVDYLMDTKNQALKAQIIEKIN